MVGKAGSVVPEEPGSHPGLVNHPHLQLSCHVLVELHVDRVDPEGLDGLLELDDALVELDPLLLQRFGDHLRGDRPEELLVLANLHLEGERDLLELVRRPARSRAAPGGPRRACWRFSSSRARMLPAVAGIRDVLGDQIVAGVPVFHVDHLAGGAEFLVLFAEDDFHVGAPSGQRMVSETKGSRARWRARLIAWTSCR